MSRRVKKLDFWVPNCITKLSGGDLWHDSKTGDKVHVSKLEAYIKKHYTQIPFVRGAPYCDSGFKAPIMHIDEFVKPRRPYSGRDVGNYRHNIDLSITNYIYDSAAALINVNPITGELNVITVSNSLEELKDELIRERRYDLRRDD